MKTTFVSFVLASAIFMGPVSAQTPAQLLQKGIFAQETEGNLDNAILLYRQVVNSATNQRDVAAQAQYRLGQALLQKGDLTTAASEFQRLARDFSDYQGLVSSLSAQTSQQHLAKGVFVYQPEASGVILASMAFDDGKKVTVTGKAVQITISNPVGSITLDDGAGTRYHFSTASARAMAKQGITKSSIKPDDTVTVAGVLAAQWQKFDNGLAGRADQVTVNGSIVFDRANVTPDSTVTPDQVFADEQKLTLMKVNAEIDALKAGLASARTTYADSHPTVQELTKRIEELAQGRERLLKSLLEQPK